MAKLFWYLNWLNFHPKSQPEGTGNLRKVAYHTLLEWYHICDVIDDLYEAYHDKPNDAD